MREVQRYWARFRRASGRQPLSLKVDHSMRHFRSPSRRRAECLATSKARLWLEPLEDRSLLSVGVGSNFGGMTFAGTLVGTPPDTQAAVGPSHIVEAVNANLAIYSKAGTRVSSQALSSLFTS